MRIRQIKTIMYRFDQRKLINLDFMLYKAFKRMRLHEHAQQCAPSARKLSPNTKTFGLLSKMSSKCGVVLYAIQLLNVSGHPIHLTNAR